jgi:hypothetical protein
MERALPSFDLESPLPCWMFDIVELTLGVKVQIFFTGEG